MVKKGIDVSKYQGVINWKEVKESGVEFAMLRCTVGGAGGGVDRTFFRNASECEKAGLPFGVYNYSRAVTAAQAKTEARLLLETVKGMKLSYPVAFDVEDSVQRALSPEALTDVVCAFCEEIEKAGYYAIIYSSKSWFSVHLSEERLKRYDKWVAQWNDKCTYKGDYGMWQYSSSGCVEGITGRCDLNEAYKDYPEIMKRNSLNGFKKEANKLPLPGEAVILKGEKVYASAYTQRSSGKLSGVYFIYDGKAINSRIRVTNSPERVGKAPMGVNVTGFVDVKACGVRK